MMKELENPGREEKPNEDSSLPIAALVICTSFPEFPITPRLFSFLHLRRAFTLWKGFLAGGSPHRHHHLSKEEVKLL